MNQLPLEIYQHNHGQREQGFLPSLGCRPKRKPSN